MLRKIVVVAIALAVVGLSSGNLSASMAVYLTDKDMALQADEIVHGVVKSKTSSYDQKTKKAYTLTTVAVTEWVKGGAGEKEITIRQIGGKIGDKTMAITGDARLGDGEEVVLFMMKGDGVRFMQALAQSKFLVVKDPITGAKLVKRDLSGLSVGEMKDGRFEAVKPQASASPLALSGFMAEIKGYLKAAKQ